MTFLIIKYNKRIQFLLIVIDVLIKMHGSFEIQKRYPNF